MANMQFNVDTTPMANTVDSARGHITGVNVAVTVMQAAVISAERDASKTICDNVDEGFYMLVKSQISQKAVAAYTEMTSRQMTLLQLAKALDNVKRQMEGDYNMISRRYAKLFQSLNKALETRVKELDRPAMQLAEIRKNMVFSKLKDDSSLLLSVVSEALPLVQTALSGKLKQKTREAMRTLSESIYESSSYSEKVDSILVKNEGSFTSEDAAANSDERYVPVIFFASDSLLNRDDHIENIFTAEADAWRNTAPIVQAVNRTRDELVWSVPGDEEKALVRKEFLSLCEREISASSESEERTAKEIMRLFDGSVWEECKK